MTHRHSTILDDIDFKIRCIAHFSKVYGKTKDHAETRKLMIDQTFRTYHEIRTVVASDKVARKEAIKLVKKYDLKEFLDMVLMRPRSSEVFNV